MNTQASGTQETSPSLKQIFLKEARIYARLAFAGAFCGVIGINTLVGATDPAYSDKMKAKCMLEVQPNPKDLIPHASAYCINWFASAPAAWISRSLGHELEPE